MSDTPQSLVERLEKGGQKALEFFGDLTPQQWGLDLYSDGAAWTVFEMFAHVVEAEGSLARLVASVAAGGEGVPVDFDKDRYNESKVQRNTITDPVEMLDLFARRRAESVAVVAALTPEDLQKSGRHPALGEAEVGEMVKVIAVHVQMHIRDVQRVLRPADAGAA